MNSLPLIVALSASLAGCSLLAPLTDMLPPVPDLVYAAAEPALSPDPLARPAGGTCPDMTTAFALPPLRLALNDTTYGAN